MAYLNKVMLIGNLGKDPEIKTTPNGRKVANFSIATSRRYRDNNGEQKEQVDWHNIVVWGKSVDAMEACNVSKGSTLFIEGSLTNRSWTDQATGQKRYTTEINCENFQMLGNRNNNGGNNNGNSRSPAERQMGMSNDSYGSQMNDDDDDLPF